MYLPKQRSQKRLLYYWGYQKHYSIVGFIPDSMSAKRQKSRRRFGVK